MERRVDYAGDVPSIAASTSIDGVRALVESSGAPCVLVMSRGGRIVGIIAEEDLVVASVEPEVVDDAMTRAVVTDLTEALGDAFHFEAALTARDVMRPWTAAGVAAVATPDSDARRLRLVDRTLAELDLRHPSRRRLSLLATQLLATLVEHTQRFESDPPFSLVEEETPEYATRVEHLRATYEDLIGDLTHLLYGLREDGVTLETANDLARTLDRIREAQKAESELLYLAYFVDTPAL